MGLGEPDIDISDVLDELGDEESDEDTGEYGDYSDYSKKEMYEEVETQGRVQVSDEKAMIMCPCKKSSAFTGQTKSFMCGLRVEAHPDDLEKSVLTCTGPIIGVKKYGNSEKWIGGDSPAQNCPYSPFRF